MSKLQNETWENIITKPDINNAYETLETKLKQHYNECFPMINKTVKLYNNATKPWITIALINSIKTKSKLYKRYIRNRSPLNEANYKQYNKLLKLTLKNAEKLHYENKFQLANGNIKSNWKIINELLHKNKKHQEIKNSFISNNKELTNKQDIANNFNSFFANIGTELASKIQNSNHTPLSFLNNLRRQATSIFIEPVVEPELRKEFYNLKDSAAGHDELKPSIIKNCFESLSKPLLYIFNKSLETGIFPDNLKVALVTPIHKKEATNLFTNYRPISVLPVFSKLLEKLMHKRITSFITRFEILYLNQFGFRDKRSTSLAIITFVDKIRRAIDNGEFSIGLFLDFSKVFDTYKTSIGF